VALAQTKFPDSKVGPSYPGWYRGKLRKAGETVPDAVKGK
jgi:hypothetical protein